ncbi:hypothetical protein Glove_9g69 [Diversispora epigaea]|uniref:Uncharacterized protein n=1 Tax=Diversispora epigaea TaxID=1348612 RepID=A0A397JNX5_9GLOM|nr:hypothetical protein Glove_9g69 [Diversispora epigaea]
MFFEKISESFEKIFSKKIPESLNKFNLETQKNIVEIFRTAKENIEKNNPTEDDDFLDPLLLIIEWNENNLQQRRILKATITNAFVFWIRNQWICRSYPFNLNVANYNGTVNATTLSNAIFIIRDSNAVQKHQIAVGIIEHLVRTYLQGAGANTLGTQFEERVSVNNKLHCEIEQQQEMEIKLASLKSHFEPPPLQSTMWEKKREICKREGIDLIEISYEADLFPYIKSKLQEKDEVKFSKKYQGDKDSPVWAFRIVIGANNSGERNIKCDDVILVGHNLNEPKYTIVKKFFKYLAKDKSKPYYEDVTFSTFTPDKIPDPVNFYTRHFLKTSRMLVLNNGNGLDAIVSNLSYSLTIDSSTVNASLVKELILILSHLQHLYMLALFQTSVHPNLVRHLEEL